jgi:hypothetical protein
MSSRRCSSSRWRSRGRHCRRLPLRQSPARTRTGCCSHAPGTERRASRCCSGTSSWDSGEDADKLALGLDPTGMDQTWDRMASQVAYGDEGRAGETVEERHATDEKIDRLKEQLAKVEARHRKEKQFARRNRLFDEANELREEMRRLMEGRVPNEDRASRHHQLQEHKRTSR